MVDDQLTQARAADGLGPHDPVERRATVIAVLERTTTGVALCFEGKEVRFPQGASAAMAAAYSANAPFSAEDLPASLDEAGRLVLVRRLVREGFLRRCRH